MQDETARNWSSLLTWSCRASVVALGAIVPMIDSSLKQMSSTTGTVSTISLWALWAVALLAILIPSSTALTAIRLALPTMFVVILCVVIGVSLDGGTAIALSLTAIAMLLAFSGDIGNLFVQISAYGDERRYLLRCPPTMAVVQVSIWLCWIALATTATNLMTGDRRIIGVVAAVAAAALLGVLPTRFHRFSRRWLVSVPAGLVVHDHVVLAETAMFMHDAVSNIRLENSSIDSEAADLGGGCGGVGLIVTLKDFDTVVLAATPKTPGGRAIHVKTMRICPTRPGRALTDLTAPPRSA